MNDSQQSPPATGQDAPGPDNEFDPHRLRSITDVKRSADDRVVAGVCAGTARYLNIDPVIVRVVIAVLTVAGFAGVILYVAAWVLLPAEGEDRSLVADWFRLDRNEEQVRVAGLVGAVILAALSVVGDSSWAWWGGAPWWLIPFALVFYVFWVRPRRRRDARRQQGAPLPDPTASGEHDTMHTDAITQQSFTQQGVATSRQPRSPALLGLTTSLTVIALAATWIYEETQKDIPWTTYVAVALAVVGVGLLIGTFFGNGGILIGIGLVLALALAVGSAFPSGRIGAQQPTPTVAADVRSQYRHGIGLLELDLSRVADTEELLGRTIELDAGIGQTKVIVPDGLRVRVTADLKAGEVSVFGRSENGTDVTVADPVRRPGSPVLSIDIDQKLGNIEVISR